MPAGCVQRCDLTASEGAEAVSTLDQRRGFQRPRRLHDLAADLARSAVDGRGAIGRVRQTAPVDCSECDPDCGDAGSGMAGDGQSGRHQLFHPLQLRFAGLHAAGGGGGDAMGESGRNRRGGSPALPLRISSFIRRFTPSGSAIRRMSLDLALFLLIALVTSNLAARLKNEAVVLRRREKEIGELHAFSQGLAACLTSRDLMFAVQDYLSNTLRYRAVLIATGHHDSDAPATSTAFLHEIRQAARKLIAARQPCGPRRLPICRRRATPGWCGSSCPKFSAMAPSRSKSATARAKARRDRAARRDAA